MSSSRLSTDKPAGSRRPHTKSERRCAEEGNSNSLEFVKQIQPEVEGELREVRDLSTNSSSDEEPSDHSNSFTNIGGVFEEDTMTYPYSKYNDEADVEAHLRAFLTTWQANHVS